jgi:hypothetical protein
VSPAATESVSTYPAVGQKTARLRRQLHINPVLQPYRYRKQRGVHEVVTKNTYQEVRRASRVSDHTRHAVLVLLHACAVPEFGTVSVTWRL